MKLRLDLIIDTDSLKQLEILYVKRYGKKPNKKDFKKFIKMYFKLNCDNEMAELSNDLNE